MSTYERREYQEEAIASCVGALCGEGCASVLLVSPVGSGKTYMALESVHRLQEALGRKLRVNWVAPRLRLLSQMAEANRGLYGDEIRPVSLFDPAPPEADLVILDEAHHEATQSCIQLYERMKGRWTIGLSATPLRTDQMRLSFQVTVKTISIGRLVREGYLSPWCAYRIPEYGVESVAGHYLAERARWGKSIVFFKTIAECEAFRERLAAEGVACEVVTATSDKERQLELFASGQVEVVANVAMLTEGFDQPDVRTVFVRDASRLPTVQMCGRGLRKAPGKAACNIVQSANTRYVFSRVTLPQASYLFERGRWLSVDGGTERVEATVRETLRRMEALQTGEWAGREEQQAAAGRAAAARRGLAMERLVRARAAEERFREEFAPVYAALTSYWDALRGLPLEHPVPHCRIHLDKGGGAKTLTEFRRGEVLVDGAEVPTLVVHAQPCRKVTPTRLGMSLLCTGIGMARAVAGMETAHLDLSDALFGLGLRTNDMKYDRGTKIDACLTTARLQLTPVMSSFGRIADSKVPR